MRLSTETRKGKIFLSVYEDNRRIAHAAGETVQEAAQYLVRHVNRIARQTEDLLVKAGHVTEADLDAICDEP